MAVSLPKGAEKDFSTFEGYPLPCFLGNSKSSTTRFVDYFFSNFRQD